MAFMVPVACFFTDEEIREFDIFHRDEEGYEAEEKLAGWYGYLTAPGYLDRTDYSGPFAEPDEAIAWVRDLYEVDENGDPIGEAE